MAGAISEQETSIYSPLPPPPSPSELPDTIRLLTIHPGTSPAVVKCTLQVTKLASLPPYECLSYFWGNPNPPSYIILNDKSKAVTPNLSSALKNLRLPDQERLIWIDALCVNQEDLEERSQQVRLMKDIYTNPWRVVIWLGEDTKGYTKNVIAIIEKAVEYACKEKGYRNAEDFQLNKDFLSFKLENEASPEKETRDLPSLTRDLLKWEEVAWFFEHDWFSRIWVIQEIRFAPVLIIYMGTYKIDFQYFWIAATWLSAKRYVLRIYRPVLMLLAFRGKSDESSLGQGLAVSSLFHATDPRDKVFALLGLTNDETRRNSFLQPDYTKSVAEVYIIALQNIIEVDQTGMELASIFRISPEPVLEDLRFPSWVCRWDISDVSPLELFGTLDAPWKTCGDTVQEVSQTGNSRVLRIKGLVLNTLDTVWHCLHKPHHNFNRIEMLWDSIQEPLARYQGPDSIQEAFIKTITITYDETIRDTDFGALELENYLAWAKEKETLQPGAESRGLEFDAHNLDNYTMKKAFFMTEENHMGLGARISQPGDIVCGFFGHPHPYLLRKNGDQYIFLGVCYLHGYMYGKAIEEMRAGKRKEQWFDLC